MTGKSTPDLGPKFRQALVAWFRRHGRDLPWRRTRDGYHVVVSEFMLQQTQVSRVLEYFPRFLARYPTIEDLARARPSTVRESWDGLGYYRRAANLHALAKVVVREHAGRLPDDPGALRALPGVGRYTAGAVASFAYERAEPAVDTNVARVIRRAFHPRRPPGPNDPAVWETARALLPRAGNAAWTFNQAIMELGALICTARVAKCGECPVRGACKTGRKQDKGEKRQRRSSPATKSAKTPRRS
ncbi:MAG: A/G-specific adenine glycosylase [Gemmatimonadales bacterium]